MRELSLHILDIVQNSMAAGAKHIKLLIDEDLAADTLRIQIVDDGCGMDQEMARKALDPFVTSRKTRHVGLGLPLFQAAAVSCNGSFSLESKPGEGTTVTATFQHSHIDRAPLGDMVGTVVGLIVCNPNIDFYFQHRRNDKVVSLDTGQIRAELAGVPINHPEVVVWIKSFLQEQYQEPGGAE